MIILIIVAGFVTASFLTQCIYRIPAGEPVLKPPRCNRCDSALKPVEIIPVLSYFFLRGRCRYCNNRLSFEYPLIELLTSFTFVALYFKYRLTVDFLAGIYLMSILIAVFFIDLHHKVIPNGLVLAGLAGGVPLAAYNLFGPVAAYGDRNWWNPLLGSVTGSGLLLLAAILGAVAYKTDDALGMGDVKIFLPIGIFLGWRLALVALVLSIMAGGVISGVLLFSGRKNRKAAIPFGPFIVTGTFTAYLWGWDIIHWYVPNFIK